MWIEILLFLLLAVCAVCDGMKKEIPLAVVWIGIALALILRVCDVLENQTWEAAALSLLPGTAFWALALLTGQKVGYGDGWMLVMVGLFTGLGRCFMIMLIGLMLESAVALALLAAGKISMDKTLPFAPFLLLGMGVVIWI